MKMRIAVRYLGLYIAPFVRRNGRFGYLHSICYCLFRMCVKQSSTNTGQGVTAFRLVESWGNTFERGSLHVPATEQNSCYILEALKYASCD